MARVGLERGIDLRFEAILVSYCAHILHFPSSRKTQCYGGAGFGTYGQRSDGVYSELVNL